MTCLEAQSKIMAFIENKLPDDELKEFIKHVKNCENCSEELNPHSIAISVILFFIRVPPLCLFFSLTNIITYEVTLIFLFPLFFPS